jgi:hypothetical protein
MSMKPLNFSIGVAMALVFMAGCEPSHDTSASAPPVQPVPTRALVISGGNAGSIALYLPSSDPDNPLVCATAGAKECPECRAAAVKYLQTGGLDPVCTRTGAVRRPLFNLSADGMHYLN